MLVNAKFKEMHEFKRVHIAKPADLFSRVGRRDVVPSPSSEDVIPMNMSKNDQMAYLQAFDLHIQREHDRSQSKQVSSETSQEPVQE